MTNTSCGICRESTSCRASIGRRIYFKNCGLCIAGCTSYRWVFGACDGTCWYAEQMSQKRSIECNGVAIQPSPRAAIPPTNAVQTFHLFITNDDNDSMLAKIVSYSNKKLKAVRANYSRHCDTGPTTNAEIRSLIDILYTIQLHQSGHTTLDNVWANDGFGVEICRLVITQ